MKDSKIIARLETIFKWLGYLMLAAAVFAIFTTAKEFARTDIVMPDGVTPANTDIFYLMPQVTNLIVFLTQAFFVLLVSHVFSLIRGGTEKHYQYGQRLMTVTCVGFVLHGLLSFGSWVHTMLTLPPSNTFSGSMQYLMTVSYCVSALGRLMPVLYAITIFVLYRHFVKMVTFESEVV
ncbi:MAG: hypothetical protein IPJ71_10920 [Bdellovibrionales bacterium]|nr:hypothetical protein [Bdellovibrionales bacterium]